MSPGLSSNSPRCPENIYSYVVTTGKEEEFADVSLSDTETTITTVSTTKETEVAATPETVTMTSTTKESKATKVTATTIASTTQPATVTTAES